MRFVDLFRQFRKIEDRSSTPADDGSASGWRSDGDPTSGALTWADLHATPRVVVLASAGSGKTAELEHQADLLTARGEAAFFLELEGLASRALDDVLRARSGAVERLEAWRANDAATAWFFLDSVDELRLVGGKLERALSALARGLDGRLGRARVLVSSRPHDWHSGADRAALARHLPVPPTAMEPVAPDEAFLGPLRKPDRDHRAPAAPAASPPEHAGPSALPVLVVELAGLDQPRVERFVREVADEVGLREPEAFLQEIGRRAAWPFTRRPLDLLDLATIWSEQGRLGTRTDQHEATIAHRLREKPDPTYQSRLTDEDARRGAERLALALALNRTRTLRTAEQPLDVRRQAGVLDPARVLPDWTEADRQALLRRALFDPATYGRTRFFHRSAEEYLAARCLLALRGRGLTARELRRLLFAEQYQTPVVIPSMRPVAAWLALWEDDVRRELLARAPEVLLTDGDPEGLSLEQRAALVRAFARRYGRGGVHEVRVSPDAVRRLAGPALAPVVRELWDEGAHHEEGGELLLELIEAGPIPTCADLAAAAVRDRGRDGSFRLAAARALLACDQPALTRAVVDEVLADPLAWPGAVVQALTQTLFPGSLGVQELLLLVERVHDPDELFGFGWGLQAVVARLDPRAPDAVALRDGLAGLIERGQVADSTPYHAASRFGRLAVPLALLCERQMSNEHPEPGDWLPRPLGGRAARERRVEPGLAAAAAIAYRFGKSGYAHADALPRLRAAFAAEPARRAAAFWADVALADRLALASTAATKKNVAPAGSTDASPAPAFDPLAHDPSTARTQLWSALDCGLIAQLTPADRPWLEDAVADRTAPSQRPVALEALLALWSNEGRDPSAVPTLAARVGDAPALAQYVALATAAPVPGGTARMLERHERRRRRRACVEERRERKRLEEWARWRDNVLADPYGAFAGEKRDSAIVTLYRWLEQRERGRNRHGVWNGAAVAEAYSPAVRDAAADAFGSFWRAIVPPLWSERPASERNQYLWAWAYALCGLAAEAETSGWAGQLTPDEARLAVRIATTEMNGLPAWLDDLADAHADVVDDVLGGELEAQLDVAAAHDHLPLLLSVSSASTDLKRLLAPRLRHRIASWPDSGADASEQERFYAAGHLEHMLDILHAALVGEDRTRVGAECARRLLTQPRGANALAWLRGVLQLSPNDAADVVAAALDRLPAPDRDAWAEGMLGRLFGRHGGIPLDIDDPGRRADALAVLLRCAYTHVRGADDQHHRGAYSPNVRDHAQHARTQLLSLLLDTPGERAHARVLELAAVPGFDDETRVRAWARERAARDAEPAPTPPEDVVALEQRGALPPRSRDQLFGVMMDRLAELADLLQHGDFTDRAVLRRVSEESEMQATLAQRLDLMARGMYRVTREEEVADAKRTDIRLLALHGDQKAAIEIKLADKRWATSDLVHALRHQVVGQYLRPPQSRAGCLLLTYDGKKQYWHHPATRARLSFDALVDYLNSVAGSIERESQYAVRLAVFGLDLRDPALVQAHR